MARHFGPYTVVKLNRLPQGPFVAHPYKAIAAALERGDLALLLCSSP